MASLGERLRAWRDAESMPRTELAAMLGVTAVTVWNWERGMRQPRPKYRKAIVHLIGQSAGSLANPRPRSAVRKARRNVTKPVQSVGTAMREAKERIALLAGVTPADVSINIRC
jgi:transcriptional regulator with XRE-family HTH domain